MASNDRHRNAPSGPRRQLRAQAPHSRGSSRSASGRSRSAGRAVSGRARSQRVPASARSGMRSQPGSSGRQARRSGGPGYSYMDGYVPGGGRAPRAGRPGRGIGRVLSRLLVVLVILAICGAGFAVLRMSNLFPIENIEVVGASHLTKEEIIQAAAVPADATMLRVDTGAIEERVEQAGWVKSASVSRQLPGTLKITVTERSIAAVVTITSTQDQQDEDWAIDADGVWLMELPAQDSEAAADIPQQVYDDASKVLRITDVPYGTQPVAGATCTDKAIINALDIVSGLTTSLADSIVQVSATDEENTTLTLDSGVEIAFGEAQDIRTKERVCLELMEQHPDQIAYINVRVVDRPTWRSI